MKKAIKFVALVYIIVGILFLSYNFIIINSDSRNNANTIISDRILQDPNISKKVNDGIDNNIKQIPEKDKKYVCGDNIQNSNYYIREFVIPTSCSQPVGLAIDNENNVWVAAGWSGYLWVFNSESKNFIRNVSLPNWPIHGSFGSIIWDIKFDKNGDLWFTDRQSNSIWKYFMKENKFEKYIIPTKNSYPISIVFDSKDRMWFTEIFGRKLGLLDPVNVKNNTTNGIKEFNLPKTIKFETLGPLSVKSVDNTSENINQTIDDNNERLWFSTVDYPYGGQIIKFDLVKENFTIYSLNSTKSVPISIVEDKNGTLWTNDHASSLFLNFDPKTNTIKQFSTSPAITRNTTNTLPYYNEYRDEKIWFNEHEGNSIASYDPINKTLIEYHIPTSNPLWGNTSNPLKFAIDNNNSIWFTEWTENKIGFAKNDTLNDLPILLALSKDKMVIDTKSGKNNTIDIYIYNNLLNLLNVSSFTNESQSKTANISVLVSSSLSKSGHLVNLTSTLSKNQLQLSDISLYKPLTLTLDIFSNTTSNQVNVGNHTLTISARYNNDITISKIIDLIIR